MCRGLRHEIFFHNNQGFILMNNTVTLRTNIHEDDSQTFDVLLSDGPDGDNIIEINCDNRILARLLINTLLNYGFKRNTNIRNDCQC
jgi:DNA-binding LacI/PurR family transcriptional regulator